MSKDTANGFMAIADCDAAIGQELNIATGVEHSIGDLAHELIAQINPQRHHRLRGRAPAPRKE